MFKDATEYDKLKAELISLYRSQASKGRKQSKEEIEKRTQSMLKFYNSSAGKLACKKQSIALKAWKRPDSVGQNISKAKKGKKFTDAHKKALANAAKNRICHPRTGTGKKYNGKTATEWANILGVTDALIHRRMRELGHPYSKTECKKRGLKLKYKVDK